MSIQTAIDAAIAEITAIVSAKMGKPVRLTYSFENDYSGTKAKIYAVSPDFLMLSKYGCTSIDEALAQALATANGMRTKADEDADLGLPIREEVA